MCLRLFKSILVFGIVLMFASSCNKGPIQYSFDGTVTESINNTGLSGVTVRIKQKILVNGATSESFSNGGSATTDGSGNYTIAFDRDKVTEFLFEFEKENYFDVSFVQSSSAVSTEDVNTNDQILDAKAWVEIDLENLDPFVDDEFKLITYNLREGCEGCGENTTTEFTGATDTSIVYLTTGGQYVRFTYINVTTGFSATDSIFATPFETSVYTLNY